MTATQAGERGRIDFRPSPGRALALTALGNARRDLAAQQASSQPIGPWLTEQARHGGIRENAATLAVLELPELHHQAAQAYADRHPDRVHCFEPAH